MLRRNFLRLLPAAPCAIAVAATRPAEPPPELPPVPDAARDDVMINVVVRDPYGHESVQRTVLALNRHGSLRRPIPIAPEP